MRLWQIISYPFRRQPRRPLAARRPGSVHANAQRAVPLGMEATDMDMIHQVNRRNDALERVNEVYTRDRGAFGVVGASTRVAPMPEDETYAARYHRAYQQKD